MGPGDRGLLACMWKACVCGGVVFGTDGLSPRTRRGVGVLPVSENVVLRGVQCPHSRRTQQQHEPLVRTKGRQLPSGELPRLDLFWGFKLGGGACRGTGHAQKNQSFELCNKIRK
jgi:hypothetical protein